MIIARTILVTLPEKQKEVLQTLLSMVGPPTNGNGLLDFGVYHDIEDSTVFKVTSGWKTRRQLNAHLSSDQFGVLLGTRGLLCKPINIEIFTVSQVEGMEAVTEARKKDKT